MYQWMDAYREGMGTTDAQKQVKQFSSKKKIQIAHCGVFQRMSLALLLGDDKEVNS
jgi:hypothetical protein